VGYDRYRLTLRELAIGVAKGVCACGLLAYTFYRSVPVFLCMLPVGAAAGAWLERRQRLEKRRQLLAVQFKEAMMLLASALSAGYSVENALASGVEELTLLYGEQGLITQEFALLVQQVRMNRPVEQALESFAARSGLEDIRSFAEVFVAAKRSSGDVAGIMRHTAEVIRDRLQMKEEIAAMTASRRFEQRIMNVIPFFIVFYVESASPGFFGQMYRTVAGRVLMSGCLAVYLLSYGLAARILAIEV